MLRSFILKRIAKAERTYEYDMSYLRALLDIDFKAFTAFAKLQSLSRYCGDLPRDAWHAARIAAVLPEDCGPCAQLMVTMAEQAGVPADTLRAVVQGDDASLSPDVRLAVRFVRAASARTPEADTLREEVIARWSKRALVSLGFAIVAARVYPSLKYALGYGQACTRITVSGSTLGVTKPVLHATTSAAC